MVGWQNSIQSLIDLYKNNFYEFFRFQRDMQVECLELIKLRNKSCLEFLENQNDLDRKKEKYYHNESFEKWQTGGGDFE